MRLACLLLIASCAATPRTELEAPSMESVVLPTRDCGTFFLADATIEGRGPFTLLIDSGSSQTHLDVDLGPRLGASTRVSLEIGRLRLRNHPVVRSELDHIGRALGEPVHGILGYSAFSDLLVTLDYPAREVRVARGHLPAPDEHEVFACSATTGPYLQLEVGPMTRTFLIDSGANIGISIRPGDEHFERPPVQVSTSVLHEGRAQRWAGRLRHDVLFGSTRLVRPIASFTRGAPTRPGDFPLVGAAVLRHFEVTFDSSSARIRLVRSGSGPLEFPPLRGIGASFERSPDGLLTTEVQSGGPCEAAGLRVGDLVLEIAGRSDIQAPCSPVLTGDDLHSPISARIRRGSSVSSLTISPDVLVP